MNKTLGSTLITSGTMIGAGMLAMPLTSAGIGFTFTVVLLVLLWILLTYSALLFVEVYQTAEHDAGIGTLAAQYFGRPGRNCRNQRINDFPLCVTFRLCNRWWCNSCFNFT